MAQKELNLKEVKKLRPVEEDGVVVVGGRTERWMQATWNKQRFILLPKNHPVSYLIAVYKHKIGGHLGVQSSIAKVRSQYWILGIAKMMRKIVAQCTKCKEKLACTTQQVMSPLPTERLHPAPAFSSVCIDYFGPFQIRGEVQKRVRGKCYGMVATCMIVRAVYVDIAADLTTNAFLQVLRRFSTVHGWPKKCTVMEASN